MGCFSYLLSLTDASDRCFPSYSPCDALLPELLSSLSLSVVMLCAYSRDIHFQGTVCVTLLNKFTDSCPDSSQ